MKAFPRRMPAGWSFTAGTLFGAIAVSVLLASPHVPRLKAGASEQPRRPAVESASGASTPQTPASTSEGVSLADAAGRPAPSPLQKGNSVQKGSPSPSSTLDKTTRHWECDLQLD